MEPPKPPSPPRLPPLPPLRRHRYKRCDVCGQIFDTQDQAQTAHHGLQPHQPLL